MSILLDAGRPLSRAVYLSVNGERMLLDHVNVLAKQLNDSGASVFIDEAYIIEAKGQGRGLPPLVLAAMCHADELIVLYPNLGEDPTVAPEFPHRDYLVIALAVAQIRGIPTTVLLSDGVSETVALRTRALPPFLDRSEFVEYDRRERYFAQRRRKAEPPPAEVQGLIKPSKGPEICLCWISAAEKLAGPLKAASKKLSRKLTDNGLVSKLVVWARPNGVWDTPHISEVPLSDPTRGFDAIAVCARDEDGPWDHAHFRDFVTKFIRTQRPVLFVRLGHQERSKPLPEYLRDKPQVEHSDTTPPSELLRLVRFLIGFRDFRPREGVGERAELLVLEPEPVRSPSLPPVLLVPPAVSPPVIQPPRPRVPTDVDYVVFCRPDGLKALPTDLIAASMSVLAETVNAVCMGIEGVRTQSTVRGRFVLVPAQAATTLDIARQLLQKCAEAGVQLGIGVATGRAKEAPDLITPNYQSPAINRAARLANLPDGAGRVAVDLTTFGDVTQASRNYSLQLFSNEEQQKVKQTHLSLRWLLDSPPHRGELRPLPSSLRLAAAHIVAYDIVGFSTRDEADLLRQVQELNAVVEDAFGAVGGKGRFQDGTNGWYAPAGDGGALVFRDGLGQSAWSFAKALLNHMTDRIQVRIGVTTGQVAVIEQNLPVGTGIFEADELASAAIVGKPCVSSRFWNQILLPGDRSGWTEVDLGGERLLVEPNAERSTPSSV